MRLHDANASACEVALKSGDRHRGRRTGADVKLALDCASLLTRGGPGVLATDALLQIGVAEQGDSCVVGLTLPRYWNYAIELLNQAEASANERAAELVLNDPCMNQLRFGSAAYADPIGATNAGRN